MLGRRGGFARISPWGWGWGGVGWGNTNPTSCYASGSLSTLLHELDGVGVGVGWGGVIPTQPDRPTSSGAPGPPETVDEVLPILKNKVHKKWHIFGSDASKGLKGARKQLEVEAATARHSLSEYTPLQKLKAKTLPPQALKGMGLKTFKKKGGQVLMVGGDQVAESHTANLKKQLRRNNKLSGLSLETAHVDGLSSLYVHSNLGLDCVLDAYAAYMHKMLDQLNPNKMFQNLDWLKPPALWEEKWQSSPTRAPVRVARRTRFFTKNEPPNFSNHNACWRNRAMQSCRCLTHPTSQNTHLATARTQFSRKQHHAKRCLQWSTTLHVVMNATWTRANPPVNPTCWFI